VSSHRLLIDFSLLPSRHNTIYFFSPPFPPRGQGGFIFRRGGASVAVPYRCNANGSRRWGGVDTEALPLQNPDFFDNETALGGGGFFLRVLSIFAVQ